MSVALLPTVWETVAIYHNHRGRTDCLIRSSTIEFAFSKKIFYPGCRFSLHQAGADHAGIAYCQQGSRSIGEILRGLILMGVAWTGKYTWASGIHLKLPPVWSPSLALESNKKRTFSSCKSLKVIYRIQSVLSVRFWLLWIRSSWRSKRLFVIKFSVKRKVLRRKDLQNL